MPSFNAIKSQGFAIIVYSESLMLLVKCVFPYNVQNSGQLIL